MNYVMMPGARLYLENGVPEESLGAMTGPAIGPVGRGHVHSYSCECPPSLDGTCNCPQGLSADDPREILYEHQRKQREARRESLQRTFAGVSVGLIAGHVDTHFIRNKKKWDRRSYASFGIAYLATSLVLRFVGK